MDTQVIDCKLIDELPIDKETRSFKREFAMNLATSIKAEGLFNPIVVRPNPDKPGRYILVQGRHRLYAVKKVLKEQSIRCTILEDMDDAEHKMASIAENLWRFEPNKMQRLKITQQWHKCFAAKHATPVASTNGTTKAGTTKPTKAVEAQTAKAESNIEAEAAQVLGADTSALSNCEPTDTESATQAEKKTDDIFTKHFSAVTGKSERTARRITQLATAFSADDLEVFSCMDIKQQQIEALLTLDAETQRKEVIALVASGLAFAEAWFNVTGAQVDLTAATKAEKAEKAVAKKEKAEELSDDDWYAAYCGEKADCLKADLGKYKADALLYRRITEARAKFRAAVKGALAEQKATGNVGFLWMAVNRVINLTHPKDWFICEDCNGTGVLAGDGSTCKKCRAGGYHLRTERYE